VGWLDLLRPDPDETARRTASALEAAPGKHAGPLGRRVLDTGLDGRGPLRSASCVADVALRGADHNSERAIEKLVRDHLAFAAVGGFVSGAGGYVTLPVALPLNLAEFYVVASRMVGSIAVVRGYDVGEPEVRTAVLLTMVASRSDEVIAEQGVGAGRLVTIGLRRTPPGVLMLVNKAILFRLLRSVNERVFPRLGRGLPLLGGGIGAVFDAWILARMAGQALVEFPLRDTTEHRATT
jgi:hypothetical protein